MTTYNSMPALQSGASPGDAMGLNAMSASGLGIDAFDPDLNFDESMLDNVNGNLPPLPFATSYDFETFSTTFEDPFNYSKPYEAAPHPEDFHEGSSPQQPDDKLLSFSAATVKATPLDDALGTYSEVGMSAELYGMFFVAEDVFGGESGGRPLELTCYRRNLWQCSGQITMPRHCSQVMNEQGRSIPIVEFYASISAIESIEGKTTEIISIPWKNGNPALGDAQETKVAGAPPKIALDLSGGQEVDGHRVSIPVSWKRLQFKSATANNGRRKGLQQHYAVQISLLGKMKTGGELMKIADIQSGPVIVRGRSPRNFDSRKDVHLTVDKKTPGPAERTRTQSDASAASGLKTERSDASHNPHNPHASQYQGPTPGNTGPQSPWAAPATPANGDGQAGSQAPPAKRMALSPNPSRPPVPSWGKEPHLSKTHTLGSHVKNTTATPSVPINLSLSEDERSPNNRSNSDSLTSPRLHRTSTSHGLGGSPMEEEEELYEYFPLSVDDWTPLVDTVYRPHIVHHIAVPQEIKAQQIRNKSKRYFSAE
ncbi:p53-like transcription factor [Durotheca rogersii]|uniref:p53-like transcription factor n=1 Tax=Durotheca rogersii TaxID=419775 RepID=UPI00221F2ACD|nr:p53-like transcription factor [Durotheca rogersii]KAI5861364.1 p53-like transcription factor [Durotheca rogersii]